MLKYILLGIGFMLLIEGLLYFCFTRYMKNMMKTIESIDLQKIKILATFVSIIGVCLIYFTIKIYSF